MQLPVLAALSGAQFMVTLDKVEYNGFCSAIQWARLRLVECLKPCCNFICDTERVYAEVYAGRVSNVFGRNVFTEGVRMESSHFRTRYWVFAESAENV